jgi:hypothetical protein
LYWIFEKKQYSSTHKWQPQPYLLYVAETFKSFGAYKPAPVVLRGCVNQMPAHYKCRPTQGLFEEGFPKQSANYLSKKKQELSQGKPLKTQNMIKRNLVRPCSLVL